MNWFQKIWANKFVRDRILAVCFLIVMFVGFWQAYHGITDGEKLRGLIPGMLCLMSVLTMVFEDYEKNNDDSDSDSGSDSGQGR